MDVDAELIKLTQTTAADLATTGAELREIVFPDHEPLYDHLVDLAFIELALAHDTTFAAHKDRYGSGLRNGIERGLTAKPLDLAKGLIERNKFRGRLNSLFNEVDAIRLPVLTGGTPTWEEADDMIERDVEGLMRFTAIANASGNPAVTFPCGFTSDGRPVGFQLVGPHCSEAMLLKVAHAYQQVTDRHSRHPELR